MTRTRERAPEDARRSDGEVEPKRGSGLGNLHAPATELGGILTIASRRPADSTLEWTVPLPANSG